MGNTPTTPSLSAPVDCGHSATIVDGAVYVCGKHGSAGEADMYRCNLETLQWERMRQAKDTSQPCARVCHLSVHRRQEATEWIYLFGGFTSNKTSLVDMWRFDLAAQKWHEVKTVNTAPLLQYSHQLPCSALVNDQWYVYNEGQLWAFSFEENRWQQLTPIGEAPPPRPLERAAPPYAIAGSWAGSFFLLPPLKASYTHPIYRYDPTTNHWSSLPRSFRLLGHGVSRFVSYVQVGSSIYSLTQSASSMNIGHYNLKENTWTEMNSSALPVLQLSSLCYHQGCLIVLGGELHSQARMFFIPVSDTPASLLLGIRKLAESTDCQLSRLPVDVLDLVRGYLVAGPLAVKLLSRGKVYLL